MHGSRAENASLVQSLLDGVSAEGGAEVVIFPPFVYLWELARQLRGSNIGLGAQSVCADTIGAFTGEISAAMLADVGCRYVLVGHSERRCIYREDDAMVARKFLAAQGQKLVPLLCVGETLEEREGGQTLAVIQRQLAAVLDVAGVAALGNAIVAYEPVWAIGTGKNATPEQAQDVHAHIRGIVASHDARIAADLRVLYGGSVKGGNAAELFSQPDVDGGLIGGASLKAEEFLKICAAAQSRSDRSS